MKRKLVIVCEEMLFMEENVCKQKENGRKLCVVSSCSGVHKMNSMNKLLDYLLK